MSIGVFDSGLGGLTVLSALTRKLPDHSFVYLGDNANAPYGVRDPMQIFDLTIAATQRLFDAGCRIVILACNTASAVALKQMQEFWVPADRRVLGVFVPMIEVLAGRSWADRSPPGVAPVNRVALFATPATISSGAFDRELRLRARGVLVEGQACAGLVDALEAGAHIAAEGLVRGFVGQLLERCPEPDAAVLGCTHYPLVEAAFRAALPDGTRILSQPDIVADALADYLLRHHCTATGTGTVSYLTTGNAAKISAKATQFLGRRVHFQPA